MATSYQNNQLPNMRKFIPLAAIAAALLFLLIFWSQITVTIDAGHGGVLFRKFSGGLDREHTYGEGFHFIAPWNKMYVYDVRQQEIEERMAVLSKSGLEISMDVSLWFQPHVTELGMLHGEIGENYITKVVIPSIRSSARSVIGRYTPEEIYSTKRDDIQKEIFIETRTLLDQKYVETNQVLIRSVMLPPTIKSAIEAKLEQEQQSLQYEFRLQKASKEAERQRIEAEGKAAANRIISESLTDRILREKGIEATTRLSESPNSKVVIIGSGSDGLPIILGDTK